MRPAGAAYLRRLGADHLMGSNRIPVLGMLIAMEIAIVGIALYAFSGVGHGDIFAAGPGLHRIDYDGAPVAPIAVGNAPRITLDDATDRIYVTVSSDRFVHIVDRRSIHGMIWGASQMAPLKVVRTADGVAISRATSGDVIGVTSGQRLDIQVPADAVLAFEQCGGAEIAGVQGGVTAHSVDGSILLSDVGGPVDVRDDDGRIEAKRLTGPTFTARSSDGRIILDGVAASKIDATTSDGRIIATLPTGTDAVVVARTDDGSILRDGTKLNAGDGDANEQTFTLGSGAGRIALATNDGTISIFTNGAQR